MIVSMVMVVVILICGGGGDDFVVVVKVMSLFLNHFHLKQSIQITNKCTLVILVKICAGIKVNKAYLNASIYVSDDVT